MDIGIERCVWGSMPPGMTSLPVASTTWQYLAAYTAAPGLLRLARVFW